MDCEYNITTYDSIIKLILDMDSQKIINPVTVSDAVIVTGLEDSPIYLTDYLKKLSENNPYIDFSQLIEELSSSIQIHNTSIATLENNVNTLLEKDLEFSEKIISLESNIESLNDLIDSIRNNTLNLSYLYQLLLFKLTDEYNVPEDPKPEDDFFDDGWDISYNSSEITGKYVWAASTIVNVSNGIKDYGTWKVFLLYDNNGNYIEGNERYEKKIYYLSDIYTKNLATPTDNYQSESWTEEPTGVSPNKPYEYISSRFYTLNGTALGEWSKPVIWSRWGLNGRDSSFIEYIYYAANIEINSEDEEWPYSDDRNPLLWTNDVNFLKNEYIRPNSGWYDNPVGLSADKRFLYVSIRKKIYNLITDTYEWQSYSKPALWSSLGKDGVNGNVEEVQGLMGPVIRFKGNYDPDVKYVNMKNATLEEVGVMGIRYIDVVKYINNYYMVLPLTEGIARVKGKDPITNSNYWEEAENFEFIATDVLYAELGKVDYLSSNEVVIFDKDPDGADAKIVAGMTGGDSKLIIQDEDTNPISDGNNSVRIWAGTSTAYNDEGVNINLLEAPFRVYLDGRFVAQKAQIEGDITANSISLLGDKVFWYNKSNIELPDFNHDLHMLAYILLYDNGTNCTISVPNNNTNTKILYYKVDTVNNEKCFEKVTSLDVSDNSLYTLISNYDNETEEYQWVITLQGVYYTNFSSSGNNIITKTFEVVTSNSTETPEKVLVYVDSINQEGSKVIIKFKFKLGLNITNNNSPLLRARILSLLIKLKLPYYDNHNNIITYSLNSLNSSFCFNDFSMSNLTDLEEPGTGILLISSKNGNYITLTLSYPEQYLTLTLNILDENGQSIGTNVRLLFDNNLNNIVSPISYVNELDQIVIDDTIKLLK